MRLIPLSTFWNFPNMSGILVLKVASGNNFRKCSYVQNFDSINASNRSYEIVMIGIKNMPLL